MAESKVSAADTAAQADTAKVSKRSGAEADQTETPEKVKTQGGVEATRLGDQMTTNPDPTFKDPTIKPPAADPGRIDYDPRVLPSGEQNDETYPNDKRPQEPVSKSNRTKYYVHKANIKDDDGKKVMAGQVAELGPELAKRYNKLGFLRPYIEDDEDENDAPIDPTSRRLKPR